MCQLMLWQHGPPPSFELVGKTLAMAEHPSIKFSLLFRVPPRTIFDCPMQASVHLCRKAAAGSEFCVSQSGKSVPFNTSNVFSEHRRG